jgi:hypothetical protein
LAVRVTEPLGHIVPEFTVTTGNAFTVKVEEAVPSHPEVVPVTVYVVVTAGLAVTTEPVVALSPVEGVHE